jgi:hypothetical protein
VQGDAGGGQEKNNWKKWRAEEEERYKGFAGTKKTFNSIQMELPSPTPA